MNSAEAALLTRELTPDHHTTAADGYTTARHGAAGNGCRDAINQHSSRTRRYGAGMRRMLGLGVRCQGIAHTGEDRKSTRLNSSHVRISYAVFCLKKKKHQNHILH